LEFDRNDILKAFAEGRFLEAATEVTECDTRE
jgi:hypothetical protein